MKQQYFIVVLAHSLHGRLRRIHVTHKFGYGVLAFALVGFMTVLGLASSYARMAWKVANYNSLREEVDSLRQRYDVLQKSSTQTKEQLASLQLFASEVSMAYGIKKKLTVSVNSPEFERELDNFAAVCRIVRGLKNLRLGALGARPTAFNTVRYSEKILALSGIEVETLDLSEVLGRISRLSDNDRGVKNKLNSIKTYIQTGSIPDELILRMAKFGYVVDHWIKATELDAVAIQCWTSVEEFYGIVPCTLMSMLSNSLVPAACEVDITGALAMYVLQLASGTPSALMDWNNNYGDDPNKCVLFHCSNLPKAFFKSAKMEL